MVKYERREDERMISINNLTTVIEGKKILNNINLKWSSNQKVGIIGLNGAGKTSIFKSILQLGFFQNNSISYPANLNIKDDIGYLSENRGLFTKETVAKNLSYFALLNLLDAPTAAKSIKFWLSFFKINELSDKKIFELSKGNQQKVQFIASIIGLPKYMILDEPFSGIDPLNADLFIQAINYLYENNTTVMYSSHQMNYVEEIANMIYVIKDGQIVESGTLNDIKNQYRTISVMSSKELEALKNKLAKNSLQFFADNNSFTVPNSHKLISDFKDYKIGQPSLEQIFKLINGEANIEKTI